jgi:hypothetical protein
MDIEKAICNLRCIDYILFCAWIFEQKIRTPCQRKLVRAKGIKYEC